MAGGADAHTNGSNGEKSVEDILIKYGLKKLIQNKNDKVTEKEFKINYNWDGEDVYIDQFPYTSCFNRYEEGKENSCKIDFYIPGYNLVIEVKTQNSHGSKKEAIPYVIENLNTGSFRDSKLLLVLLGDKIGKGAIGWAKQKAKEIDNLEVFSSLEELDDYISKLERRP